MNGHAPGTLVKALNIKGFGCPAVFERQSSWSRNENLEEGSLAIVLQQTRNKTGMGRHWHQIMVMTGVKTIVFGWVEDPGLWEEVSK